MHFNNRKPAHIMKLRYMQAIGTGLLTVFGFLSAQAAPLTPVEAWSRVGRSNNMRMAVMPPVAMTVADSKGEAALYVFSQPAGGGFIIAGADDVAPPMLGYSDTGTFDAANVPCGLEMMMEQYAGEIEAAKAAGAAPYSTIRLAASADYPAIAPLCATTWNQSDPYNLFCPMYDGKRSVTGCVATAMAQILKKHNYPAKGTGSHTYTYNGVTMTYNFADTTFYWSRMLNSYSTTTGTTSQKNAVASLMHGCGVGVDMMYSPSASGAYSSNVPDALKNYFGYAPSATYIEGRRFTTPGWNDVAYQTLKAGFPIYVSGQNNSGGHAFVCDGYSSEGFFHINWGWGGLSDGYFRLRALDPNAQGIGGSSAGYNAYPAFVVMIQPATPNAVQPYVIGTPEGYKATLTGHNLSLRGTFYNYTEVPTSAIMGVKIIAPDGTWQFVAQNKTTKLNGYGSIASLDITIPDLSADGIYTVEPWLNAGTAAEPDLRMIYNAPNYPLSVRLVKVGESLSIKDDGDVSQYPTPKDVKFYTSMYVGYPFSMSLRLNNFNQNQETTGNLYLFLYSSDGKNLVTYIGPTLYDLMPGEEEKYTFTTSWPDSPSAGDYRLCVGTEKNGYVVPLSDMIDVKINPAPTGTPKLTLSGFGAAPGLIYTDKQTFNATLKCTGGYFADRLILFLFNSSQTYMNIATYTPTQFIEAGQTKTCEFDTYWSLEPNTSYYVQLQNGSTYLNRVRFSTSTTVGIESVEEVTEFHVACCGGNIFTAVAPEQIGAATLYSIGGAQQYVPVTLAENRAEINASALSSGIYVLRIVTGSRTYNERIIIR